MNPNRHIIIVATCIVATTATAFAAPAPLIIDNSDKGFSSAKDLQVTCLKYHGLSPDCGDSAFSPAHFDKQIKWLHDNSFESIDLPHLVGWIREGIPALPTKPVLLVADDNYLSIYTVAYPTLKKYGFMGYNCAHSRYVGTKTQWPHANWAQLNEMEKDGTIITESHSATHPNLNKVDDVQMHDEIYGSKADFEKNMPGKKVFCFAYPMAVIDDRATAAVRLAGYRAAMCGRDGLINRKTDPYLLTRFIVDPLTTTTMETYQHFATAGLGTGAWQTMPTTKGIGKDCAIMTAGDGTANACWQWTPDKSGQYEVAVHLPEHGIATATDALYTIKHKDGISTATINQAALQNTEKWISLGTYRFTNNKSAYVALNNKTDGTVAADAIRITPVIAKKKE